MMSEKRFVYGVIKGSRQAHIKDCHTCKSATIDVYDDNIKYFVDKLNELAEENEQLKQKIQLLEKENEDLREVNKENQVLHEENVKQCERWKNLYELKDAEVTARVDTLNRVCEYYTSEVLFKSDVDPNEAVKEVIKEILNTEVENDE